MRFGSWARGLLLALLVTTPALLQAQTTTVIVVRHADKVDTTRSSPLSEAGRARAETLAAALADARVEAIYVTQYPRSRLSAEPLARRLGLTPRVVEAGGETAMHARAVAERIRAEAAGRTVLVIGHSNTVPAIVAALGGGDVGRIEDPEYDHMFIVLLDAAGTRVVRAGYPPR
jgi:broad specificity phosphatase PhoE